jgi:hypothetical protein
MTTWLAVRLKSAREITATKGLRLLIDSVTLRDGARLRSVASFLDNDSEPLSRGDMSVATRYCLRRWFCTNACPAVMIRTLRCERNLRRQPPMRTAGLTHQSSLTMPTLNATDRQAYDVAGLWPM